jgi:hypothetical protein
MLLHGEQYLSIKKFPIPTSGSFTNTSRIMEVLDKGRLHFFRNYWFFGSQPWESIGKAASVTTYTETVDKTTGEVVFENQSTVFIRGAGGFGGKKTGKGR